MVWQTDRIDSPAGGEAGRWCWWLAVGVVRYGGLWLRRAYIRENNKMQRPLAAGGHAHMYVEILFFLFLLLSLMKVGLLASIRKGVLMMRRELGIRP